MIKSRKEKQKISIRDIWLISRFILRAAIGIVQLVIKVGPIKTIKTTRRYPWLKEILLNMKMAFNFLKGRSGNYLEAVLVVFEEVQKGTMELLEGIINHEDKLVVHQVALQPEILMGMGLKTWMAGFVPWVGTVLSPGVTEKYIDVSKNEGMPSDLCSASLSTIGFALENQFPDAAAIVASAMPCDGVSNMYSVIERKTKIPTFMADAPYDFNSDRGVDYFVKELKRMISFLEANTPGRMDWDRLREICELRNRTVELELDLWDMIRQKPSPMAAEPIYFSHIWFQAIRPGCEESYRMFKRIADLCEANFKRGKSALPDERYRVVLWNAPMIDFSDIFVWAEKRYGVSLIMDMLTYNHHPFIDTSTPETMLRDLAKTGLQSVMGRHTRGPCENYIDDLFYIYEHFNLDMIWVASSLGCRNTKGLLGIVREKCREKGIPLLSIDHEIFDARTVPRANMMNQVDDFMINIMEAERLDR
jgi:hypothetical protein